MNTWRCTIPGSPMGKGRPRVAAVNGRPRVYPHKPTEVWEARAAVVLGDAWPDGAIEEGCSVRVLAIFPRPGRLRWKRRPMVRCPHLTKPDVDNVAKIVLDSLQRAGVIRDDRSVWDLGCMDHAMTRNAVKYSDLTLNNHTRLKAPQRAVDAFRVAAGVLVRLFDSDGIVTIPHTYKGVVK